MGELPNRVYVETSVISGMLDSNDHPTKAQPFWDAVFDGRIRVVLSDVLDDELKKAPDNVKEFYRQIPEIHIEWIVSTSESKTLAERYIKAGILTLNHFTDCEHVALAMLSSVDVLVSWNSKHIVKENRIRRFNDVSIGFGCDGIKILTPNNLTQRGECSWQNLTYLKSNPFRALIPKNGYGKGEPKFNGKP
jgi:predicted nucleic acid-binding protein